LWDGKVSLGGLNWFKDDNNPDRGILWVGVNSPSLIQYQSEIARLFMQSGVEGEGYTKYDYNPHVTIAYCPLELAESAAMRIMWLPVDIRGLDIVMRKK
jgi:2'-5' RNA ligase